MHRWGYAPTVGALSRALMGGPLPEDQAAEALARAWGIRVREGFVSLPGHEDLIERSRGRVRSHQTLNGGALTIARSFAEDFVAWCPFVEIVALSGSAASGGFGPADDIDFDIVVRPGTKYTSYLAATLVGLKYAWRYRGYEIDGLHRTPFLPKVTCVNVVWATDEARPFLRQDEDMAFELLRCRPLFGATRFRELLEANPWLHRFFPQIYGQTFADEVRPRPAAIGRFLERIGGSPGGRRGLEALSRAVMWALYHYVQWTRRRNPAAVERIQFLRRVKYPYEFFQD